MDNVSAPGLDLQDNLEFLKDALTVHFMSIRDAESMFGQDHAGILKDHIDRITSSRPRDTEVSQVDAERPTQLAVLPRAISRFAPRATLNPASNWGLLGKLPRELRDIIYEDALSHDCSTYLQACNCTKEDRRSKSGIALLRTCGRIHNEVVPILYESEVFGISLGYEVSFDGDEETVEWLDPVFYRQTALGRQTINRLPHNVFRLIQNLQLNFTNEGILWQHEPILNISASTDRLLQNVIQTCANLQDSIQLRQLDITLSFCCMFNDIDSMARLLEPIKKLRNIKDLNITVCGYESSVTNPLIISYTRHEEPRWGLTDEYTGYLQSLLMSPHGTPTPPSDGLEVFEDDYEELEEYEYHPWHLDESDEQYMRRYLRDVYGTEDLEALHGGMPERWQVWLNSEHGEDCEWFNADGEETV